MCCICSDIKKCGYQSPALALSPSELFLLLSASRPIGSRAGRGTGHLREEFHRQNTRFPHTLGRCVASTPGCQAARCPGHWAVSTFLGRRPVLPVHPASLPRPAHHISADLPGLCQVNRRRSLTKNWTTAPFSLTSPQPISLCLSYGEVHDGSPDSSPSQAKRYSLPSGSLSVSKPASQSGKDLD